MLRKRGIQNEISLAVGILYKDKSPEELRWEHYQLGDKGFGNSKIRSIAGLPIDLSSSSAMPNLYLPEDIIFTILSRLPVKSLLRFRSVCKSWKSQISQLNFSKMHLNHRLSKSPSSLVAFKNYPRRDDNRIYLLHLDSFENSVLLDPPPTFSGRDFASDSNGIICLANGKLICLWNPATRHYLYLPPPLHEDDSNTEYYLGFGFNSSLNDSKVLRIGYKENSGERFQVEVYSTNSDSWRKIQVEFRCGEDNPCWFATVKGVQYWDDMDDELGIISFDMDKEVFGRICLPKNVVPQETHTRLFVNFKDSVAVIVYPRKRKLNKGLTLWMMDDKKCWTKKFNFEGAPLMMLPFQCLTSGKIMGTTDGRNLFLYDPETDEIKNVGFPLYDIRLAVFYYSESLVSIKGSKQLPPKAKEEIN